MTLGGLLPFSDAADYYGDAIRLLEGNTFSAFSTRRPLFPGFLATMLFLAGRNLKLTLALLCLITTVTIFLASTQIRKNIGIMPAALFMFLCFLFYRRFIGIPMTEHLGISLGASGLSLVLYGATDKRTKPVFWGIFILTLALNARAGAFFVLPMLVLWATITFRCCEIPWHKIFLIGSLCIVTGFLFNYLLVRIIGNSEGEAFSNFAYTLYGLVFGGYWGTVVNNPPPEIIGLGGKALTDKLYQLSINAIMDNPSLLISGMFRAWKMYIVNGVAFSFVISEADAPIIKTILRVPFAGHVLYVPYLLKLIVTAMLHTLSLAGIYWSFRNRKKEGALIIVFLAGLFFSIPFAPPWDSDNGRVYAATVPFMAFIPSYGLGMIISIVRRKKDSHCFRISQNLQQTFCYPKMLYTSSIILALACIAGPIMLRYTQTNTVVINKECPEGAEDLMLNINPGSYLTFVDDQDSKTMVPRVQLLDFKKNMEQMNYLYPEGVKELRKATSGQRLFLHDKGYIILDSSRRIDNLSRIHLCGEKKQVKWMNIYYVK